MIAHPLASGDLIKYHPSLTHLLKSLVFAGVSNNRSQHRKSVSCFSNLNTLIRHTNSLHPNHHHWKPDNSQTPDITFQRITLQYIYNEPLQSCSQWTTTIRTSTLLSSTTSNVFLDDATLIHTTASRTLSLRICHSTTTPTFTTRR